MQPQVVDRALMYEVVKTKGTGVFANAHVLAFHSHQHVGSSWLIVVSLFLVRERAVIIMHGRSRMTIDPRIPAMLGRSTSGFHRPGRYR